MLPAAGTLTSRFYLGEGHGWSQEMVLWLFISGSRVNFKPVMLSDKPWSNLRKGTRQEEGKQKEGSRGVWQCWCWWGTTWTTCSSCSGSGEAWEAIDCWHGGSVQHHRWRLLPQLPKNRGKVSQWDLPVKWLGCKALFSYVFVHPNVPRL